jgi:formylglycine-generating enzyme required for sulfatase activity
MRGIFTHYNKLGRKRVIKRRWLVLILVLAVMFHLAVPASAKDKKKAPARKPTVVLLPINLIGDQSREAAGNFHSAVAESLQSQYKVIAGTQVEEKLKKALSKENKKAECDLTACYGAMAVEFNAEYVAVLTVTKLEGDYTLSLNILDYAASEVKSKTDTCSGCKIIQVVEKLKLLAGGGEKAASVPAVETPSETAQPSKVTNANDMELTLWNSIKDGASPDDFAAYIESYPKGTFAPLAKRRIAALKKSAAQEQESASKKAVDDAGNKELSIWNSVKDSANPDDFVAYLQDYPKGKFAPLAKSRMASLKKSSAQEQESASKKAAEDAANKEHSIWNSVKDSANPDDFSAYLQDYPKGTFATLAKSRMAALKKSAEQAQSAAQAAPTPAATKSAPSAHEGMVYVKKGGGGFYMDKYLVTQEAYQRVTGQSPSYFKNCPACPVEQVNWDEATSYCSKVGKKLPKEEDWEYAATSGGKSEAWAGTSTESELGDYAWYYENSGNKTHPVGEKKPNGLGLYDMSGNVLEWTDGWYNSSQKYRVLRGGSWVNSANGLRAAARGYGAPVDRDSNVGFRCAQY